jgi:hypothetical protein
LKNQIHVAIAEDEHDFQIRQQEFSENRRQWEKRTEHAKRVLNSDAPAMLDVLNDKNPFAAIAEIGTEIRFEVDGTGVLSASANVHSEEIVPNEEFGFYKSGKVSAKKMTRSKYYEIYQDYICSVVLRIARETYSLLPVDIFIVTAVDELLKTETGKMEVQPILSVCLHRSTLESLDFERIDPSNAMRNFIHNMDFKKTQGFKPISVVTAPRRGEVKSGPP